MLQCRRMGIASIVLNVLSVMSLPMVLAVGVMTTDSPRTPKGHFRALRWFLGLHLFIVAASIPAAWGLRSAGRPGAALWTSLSPAAWVVVGFALLWALDFGGARDKVKP